MRRLLLNPDVRGAWATGDARALLDAYERVWERKTVLRQIYAFWYQMILDDLRPGNVVEVGAGTGNFRRWLRDHHRDCWSSDLLPGRFVDVQADGLRLPFRSASLDNLVLIDVLHHLARPGAFLQQAARLLRGGGRLLLVEPFVSIWGQVVYRWFHHERVDFDFDESTLSKEPWDGNAAIPRLMLSARARTRLPLNLVKERYGEFLAYPLSGGFSYRAALPAPLLLALHRAEQARLFQNRFLALRIFAVLEKPT